MRFGLGRALLQISLRHPGWMIALWLLAMSASVAVIAWRGGSAFSTQVERDDGSESTQVRKLLRERFANLSEADQPNEIVVVHSPTLKVDDPAFRDQAETLAGNLMKLDAGVIEWAASYLTTADESLVSADRHTTLVPMRLKNPERDIGLIHQALLPQGKASDLRAYLVGRTSVGLDFKRLAEQDLKAELRIGLPVAIGVLLIVFATLLAALLPVIVALAAILVTMAISVLAGPWMQAYFLATNMIVMMGLAVGIDYSLFVLSRYREERAGGSDIAAALTRAGDTTGHAIVYSGATVVLALLGLLIIPTNIFRSLAAGAILVVLVCLLAAFTLLPALIARLGDRLEAWRLPLPRRLGDGVWWDRLTGLATRHPVSCLVLTVSLLVALALPTLGMKTGFSGIETLPAGTPSKVGFDLLERQFRVGAISEAVVVIDGKADAASVREAIAALRVRLKQDPAFVADKARLQSNREGNLSVLTIPMVGESESAATQEGVRRLRSQHLPAVFQRVPARALVGGNAAGYIDFFRLTDRYTPIVFGFVLSLSFVLLMIAFRSVVVPLKAIVLNLLSVGAAYGLMVLVFQQGVGASLLGFVQVPVIEAWIPLFLFTILYGLSMDYHVFLLSRVREQFDLHHDNARAIRDGVRGTAGVITGAALIMVAVFAGFAGGELVMFQQVGFGLAVAVLLDATLVRSLLVPAAMILLGDGNWYLPRWLNWLPR